MRITALAGGVGGARLANGLQQCLQPGELTVIVNTGDDFEHFGLYICPDLDTVCYNLAGLANPETGWGRRNESWQVIESIRQLGGPDWFNLGDRDLGTHLERTRRVHLGEQLSQITLDFARRWSIPSVVLPMTDQPVRTNVLTKEYGLLPFQEYFVKHRCSPSVTGFHFEGIDRAKPATGVLEAISESDFIVLCPSNPWVSIDPILSVRGIREAITNKVVLAVSPIIQGAAVKGPAAKMFQELGIKPSAFAVAEHYQDLLSGFIFDSLDHDERELFPAKMAALSTDTLMRSIEQQARLAQELIAFGKAIQGANT